ncbi:CBM35 domain-containing protein [Paenibacillus sp. LHD-117]|uniref:carbohydrate-binding protein n=1 Tax=Paenibacillus sp. LHD-117 TaxID=3071412 RepID=UPI0027E1158D|nr:CBM35 domain-containing protein [Paenibacillus sp. LHD-117]MDQ6420505.1 CBM35 domain-containing protein [Paenibacillus sp. LHD-117]
MRECKRILSMGKRVAMLTLATVAVLTVIVGIQPSQVFAATGTATIDYSSSTGTGYPDVIGGTHFPTRTHTDAWNKLDDTGLVFMRADLRLQDILPANITLNDYKNNVNQVQDPANWNFTRYEGWTSLAKSKGFKTMGMIFELPKWLSWSGTEAGVPKDWDVYEDIVAKVYDRLKNNLDMMEFLNEPHGYIVLTGSPYATKEEAAVDQYYHSAKAIRSISAIIPIGGPGEDTWGGDFGTIGRLLRDSRITSNDLNFISVHDYEYGGFDRIDELRRFIAAQGRDRTIPIFMNEWNKTPNNASAPPEVAGREGISYHGQKLMKLMRDGVAGGAYYTLYPTNVVNDDYWAWTEVGHGAYSWNSTTNTATMQPFNRTWRLYSTAMGLGAGNYGLRSTTYTSVSQAQGIVNHAGQPVALAVNHSGTTGSITLNLTNLPVSGNVTVEVYTASETNDASAPSQTLTRTVASGALSETLALPAYSTVGLIVKGGTPASLPQTSYEAESLINIIGGSARISEAAYASNNRVVGYIGGNAANKLTFPNVTASSAGNQTLRISYVSGEARSATLSVNGAAPQTLNFPSTGGWSTTGFMDVTVALQAGVNTLTFANTSSFAPDLDKITVLNANEIALEAESATNTLAGNARIMDQSTASGGKIVGYIGNGSANYLQFNNVQVSSAGTYQLTISYITADARSASLSINGGPAQAINFPGSGSWSTVSTVVVPVTLAAGSNTLRFSNATGYSPDIDRITLAL